MKKIALIFLLGFSLQACKKVDNEILTMIDELEKQNILLTTQLDALKKLSSDIKLAVTQLNANQNTKDQQILQIQTDLNALLAQINTLNTQLKTAGTTNADLAKKIADLQVKVFNLLNQVSSINDIPMTLIYDVDGNSYKIIKIGNQFWMAENLKTTRFSNGENLNFVDNKNNNNWYDPKMPAYRVYYDNLNNKNSFGFFYNWQAVSDPRNICPQGWRVPSEVDWENLETYLGLTQLEIRATGSRGASLNIGGKLKQTGFEFWNSPNLGATNETGFNVIGSGRYVQGDIQMFETAFFWSSTSDSNDNNAWGRAFSYGDSGIFKVRFSGGEIGGGWSCRCLKN